MRHMLTEPRPYRFSREEFEQMGRCGWLAGQTPELIDGAVVVRTGTNGRLAAAAGRGTNTFR